MKFKLTIQHQKNYKIRIVTITSTNEWAARKEARRIYPEYNIINIQRL